MDTNKKLQIIQAYLSGTDKLTQFYHACKIAENALYDLSSLQADNERLKGLVATDLGVGFKMETEIVALQAENKALNEQLENGANQYAYAIVDNERLREALKEMFNVFKDSDKGFALGMGRDILKSNNIK